MQKMILFGVLSTLSFALASAQMVMPDLGANRSTYNNAEHVPASAWKNNVSTSTESASTDVREAIPRDQLQMVVAPNPAREEAILQFHLPHATALQMDLIDARGQILRTLHASRHQARGQFEKRVSLLGLARGVYYVRIRLGEELHSLPIVKE